MALRRIGQILVDLGFLTEERVKLVLDEQRQRPTELFGQVAIGMGLVTDEQLVQGLGEQMGLQVISLAELVVPPNVLSMITETMAQLYRIVPVAFEDETLTIAMCDPQKLSVVDELRSFVGVNVRAVVATEKDVLKALTRYYAAGGESVENLIADMEQDTDLAAAAAALEKGVLNLDSAEALADSAPVRKLLNMVLLMAIKDQASDLHFEPFENEFKIRIRADGVLYEMVPPPRHLAFAITTRIKVMANLDIAERRVPQDGRIRLTVGGHPVDLRVSVLPTMFGESVVMRVLDRGVVMLDLGTVGMEPATLAAFRETIRLPNGIVLVTGPTGSGKTTTLYGALNELNVIEDKLITTEDPVEYEIEGIVQIPIDPNIGNTFAQCLRSILRQDPDKILVGEIRDLETAEIAVQASLTGHLVFSTLHTNDAPSTITRLRDMGVPPFLLTATLEAVLAQRLVRKICPNCREQTMPNTETLAMLDLTPDDVLDKKFYRGRGCQACNNTGFKGRTGLHELMLMNDQLRELIQVGSSTEKLRDCALQTGMRSLRKAGLEKVYTGITAIEEVIRETVHE
jgi:type IV pilus assembly protein PilB